MSQEPPGVFMGMFIGALSLGCLGGFAWFLLTLTTELPSTNQPLGLWVLGGVLLGCVLGKFFPRVMSKAGEAFFWLWPF